MKTRLQELAQSDKPGHFVVELPGKGPHPLRAPTPSRASRVRDFRATRAGSPETTGQEQAVLFVGLAWRHPVLEFEAVYPSQDDDAALAAYAEAVWFELEAEGYTVSDVMRMSAATLRHVNARIQEYVEAAKLEDFFGAPPGGTSG